jgi:transposase-like protein
MRREAEWLAIVSEYESSGVTAREFASSHGLSVKSLYGWRARLKSGGSEAPGRAFVAVQLPAPSPSPAPSSSSAAAVVLLGDVQLRLSSDADPRWAGALVRAIAGC